MVFSIFSVVSTKKNINNQKKKEGKKRETRKVGKIKNQVENTRPQNVCFSVEKLFYISC